MRRCVWARQTGTKTSGFALPEGCDGGIREECEYQSRCLLDWCQMVWLEGVLSRLFKTPTSFEITKYHVITFRSEEPGFLKVKELASTLHFFDYCLFKRGVTEEIVRQKTTKALHSPAFVLPGKPLRLVPLPQEHSRRGYLERNVCQKYYEGNQRFADNFFGNEKEDCIEKHWVFAE